MHRDQPTLRPSKAIGRAFLKQSGRVMAALAVATCGAAVDRQSPMVFRLWASGDCHVGTDLNRDRESLADAIRQSEGDGTGFQWDLAVHVGDFSGNQGSPKDDEGREVVRQFASLRKHRREQWKVTFANVAALTRYHAKHSMPMSRLLTFTEGSRSVKIQCYLHTPEFAARGWYTKAERTIELSKPFRMQS